MSARRQFFVRFVVKLYQDFEAETETLGCSNSSLRLCKAGDQRLTRSGVHEIGLNVSAFRLFS